MWASGSYLAYYSCAAVIRARWRCCSQTTRRLRFDLCPLKPSAVRKQNDGPVGAPGFPHHWKINSATFYLTFIQDHNFDAGTFSWLVKDDFSWLKTQDGIRWYICKCLFKKTTRFESSRQPDGLCLNPILCVWCLFVSLSRSISPCVLSLQWCWHPSPRRGSNPEFKQMFVLSQKSAPAKPLDLRIILS